MVRAHPTVPAKTSACGKSREPGAWHSYQLATMPLKTRPPAWSTKTAYPAISGQSGSRSERQLIVSADASKRLSRRTSMLTTPIFEIPAEQPTKQLREKLPRRPKRVVRHHPALSYAEAPHFMACLTSADGIAASMLCFLIFTVCRTNDGRRWSEINRPLSTWKIPGDARRCIRTMSCRFPNLHSQSSTRCAITPRAN